MDPELRQYRAGVIQRHKEAFDLHAEVASLVESTLFKSRARSAPDQLVTDMLLIQCVKAHAGVSLLAQHGLMEDTATLTRRLLELSIQVVYIGAEGDVRLRDRKAGRYIAFMWREIPKAHRNRLPPEIRETWSRHARKYGRFIGRKAKTWGPNWRDMFSECGLEAMYVQDYSFLSGIAHGRSSHQVFQFSSRPIRVHHDDFASVTLIYASRYLLAAVDGWDMVHHEFDRAEFSRLATATDNLVQRAAA